MAKPRPPITFDKRVIVERMIQEGHTPSEIARVIGVAEGTVYRELKKGHSAELGRYDALYSETRYREAITRRGPKHKIPLDEQLVAYIEKRIIDDLASIDDVVQEINLSDAFSTKITRTTIYKSIEGGLFPRLTQDHLPHRRNKAERELLKNLVAEKMAALGIEDYEALAQIIQQKKLSPDVLEKKILNPEMLYYRDLRRLAAALSFTDEDILSLFRTESVDA